jgi:hypothetical protein
MYAQYINMDILGARSSSAQEQVKIYEGRVRSSGRCAKLSDVIDEILDATFQDFPGESG